MMNYENKFSPAENVRERNDLPWENRVAEKTQDLSRMEQKYLKRRLVNISAAVKRRSKHIVNII